MIFASKTPRDLNHDRLPYHCADGDHRTEARMVEATSGQGYVTHPESHWWERRPRPEFDHIQHNEPNPILVAFRIRNSSARDWLRGSVLSRVAYNVGATTEQQDHARRVLNRIARLTQTEN